MLGVAGGKESVATLARSTATAPTAKVQARRCCAPTWSPTPRTRCSPSRRATRTRRCGAAPSSSSAPWTPAPQLRELYERESAPEVRRTILEAMGVAGDVEALAQAARGESDAGAAAGRHPRRSASAGSKAAGNGAQAALRRLRRRRHAARRHRGAVRPGQRQGADRALPRREGRASCGARSSQKLSMMDSPEATELLLKMLDE